MEKTIINDPRVGFLILIILTVADLLFQRTARKKIARAKPKFFVYETGEPPEYGLVAWFGLILLKIFGQRSVIGRWLYDRGVEIVFNWKGVLVAMAVMSFPLLVRSMRISFSEVNPRLEQIAATLGASPSRIFLVVTIPLAMRGIIAGFLLAFSRALGEFGATILLAGNIPGKTQTLSLAIFNLVQLGKDREAYNLLAITVVLAFVSVWFSEWLHRSRTSS